MRISKSQICWVRPTKRLTAGGQKELLQATGCGQIFVADDRWQVWNEMIDQLRTGDVVKVRFIHLFVPERWQSNQNRYRWLWDCVHAIEDRGASWIEIETGRKSTVPRERDDAIRDALEYIRSHINSPLRKLARENGKRGGRPPTPIKERDRQAARAFWFDRQELVGKRLRQCLGRVGYTLARCYREFGPRGGRET